MIALKILSMDKDVEKEKRVFEFANAVNENLEQLIGEETLGVQIVNVAKLAKNFNLEIHEGYRQIHEALHHYEIHPTLNTQEDHTLQDVFEQ